MTLEEFLSKYSKEGLDLDFKNNIPNWFNVQTKSQGSRNITIEAWNDVVRTLGRLASGDNTSYEMLRDIVSVLNNLRVELDGKLDLKPFTNSDAGKFVAIGPDGSLVAVHPPSGGGGGGGGIVIETDPTVPDWAKQPNPPTPDDIGAVSEDTFENATRWVQDIDAVDDSEAEMEVPPTTRAVRDSLTKQSKRIDGMGANINRFNEDLNSLNNVAIGNPQYVDGTLKFTVVGTDEIVSVDISSGGGGGSSDSTSVSTLPLQHFKISDSNSYSVVKLSDSLYGARLLLTSENATCTYGTKRKVACANWSVVPTQDFTVVVGDSPLHTDYHYSWDYNSYTETTIEGLAYMVDMTLNRSSGLLTISTTSRNFLSYFPEFDYYVELEINTAIKRALVRVTQLKIY